MILSAAPAPVSEISLALLVMVAKTLKILAYDFL